MPGSGFGRVYGILQHRGLPGPETRRKTGITIRAGVIANPEINTTVGGQKHTVASNKAIVHPTRRRTGGGAQEKQDEGADSSAELGMSGNRRLERDGAN